MKIIEYIGGRLGALLLAISALTAIASATDGVETMYLTATVLQNQPTLMSIIPEGDGEMVEVFDIIVQDTEEENQEPSQEENHTPEEKETSMTEEVQREESDAEKAPKEEPVTEEPAEQEPAETQDTQESKEPEPNISVPTEKVEGNTTSNESTEAE